MSSFLRIGKVKIFFKNSKETNRNDDYKKAQEGGEDGNWTESEIFEYTFI